VSSDDDLVRRARVGDELGFRELWSRHSAALLDFLWRAAGPGIHAPDVLTEAYLEASRRIGELADGGSVARWLRGIVEEKLKSSAPLGARMRDMAREAMAKLPRRDREILRLIHEERLTVEDAALRLGQPPDEVRALYEAAFARFSARIRRR
jgi:DNA-directed RNA polymerase specialized sigma24 family protein